MVNPDWLIEDQGEWIPCKPPRQWDLLRTEYRFYRFLTEVEDGVNSILESGGTEADLLVQLRRLVRQLTLNSYWVKTQIPPIDTATGTGIQVLYDEIGFPLTVQTEAMTPQTRSPIHSHGTWGIVAVLQGQQKNVTWRRSPSLDHPNQIERVGERILIAGDIISFTESAIHEIEAVGNDVTVTFNLYGETQSSKRFQFDPTTHSAKKF